MNISEIASIMNGELIEKNQDVSIQWLLTDSRTVSFPEETLFFAIKTSRNDGHLYIKNLYDKKVRNFVVSDYDASLKQLKNANIIVVENTLKSLQKLAIYHRNQFDIPVVGITGSNGKTIVKEWLYQLLHKAYNITRSPRSYNSQIGVPLSVWQLDKNTELGIFEAGISLMDEMEKLEPIIRPTVGIFTHMGEAHQENFSSLKEKCLEKLKLFAHAEVLIYCIDEKLVDICVDQSGYSSKKFTWGKNEKANIQLIEIKKDTKNTEIIYSYKNKQASYRIPFTDDASIENSMHCLACMLYLNIDTNTVQQQMQDLQPVAMRLEVKEGMNNCLIINDSYNSDLSSLSIALDFLQQQASDKNVQKTLILSDILQSGQPANELYQTVATLAKNKGISQFIGIGHELMNHKELFNSFESSFFATSDEFLSSKNAHFHNKAILLKGSRNFHFERISEALELVAHQTILEVNLNALVHNFNYFRSYLKPETKTICMVKAYAYGSGAAEISRTLQHNKCDYLAVAVADEGAELRNEGIHIPIMVMNPEQHSLSVIFEHNLEPEIYSFKLLDDLIKEAEKQGVINYPVHIKIDTGMNRLGFSPTDVDKLIDILQGQNNLKIRSVFSHLVGTDSAQFDGFTHKQINLFEEVYTNIAAGFEHKILKHILNSAGIERFPEYQYDMVRLGIGHYGISAVVNQQCVENVCTLKTTILQIKDVPKGETIGYSRKGVVRQNSRIATLPIGYADGYNRRLGNGVGSVLVNGKLAPVIGNICMDLTMIDITGIDAKEGDTVEIFGNSLSIKTVAEWLHTIPYEILTNVSRRVKRIYFQE